MAVRPHKQGDFTDTLVVEKQRNGVYGTFELLDTRWSGAMGDHELEEGEACDDLDSSCDPDTEFSYLDEKLSMVLGDVQKYFEGGVSAEKLGSKFGGYGSFLPTQERTQSTLHKEKAANVMPSDGYCRTKKFSSEGIVEKIKRTAAGSSAVASNSKAGSSSAKSLHENGDREPGPANARLCNLNSSLPAVRIEENAGQPKKVTLRIRMGSDTTNERNKKSTIYSDFGLSNSSSATEDEDEDQGSDSDLDSSSDQSPLTMIRAMTSNHIPDGMLLSPLPDIMVEPSLQKERLWLTNRDTYSEKARSPCVSKGDTRHGLSLLIDEGDRMETPKEKVRESVNGRKVDGNSTFEHAWKKAKYEKGKEGSKHTDALRPPSKALVKDFSNSNEPASVERQARDAGSESGTGLRSMDSHREARGLSVDKVPAEYPSYEADRAPRDLCSPFQPVKDVDRNMGRESLSRGYKVEKAMGSSSHDSMNGHLDTGIFASSETGVYRCLDAYAGPEDFKKNTVKEIGMRHEAKAYTSQDATKKSTSKANGGGKFAIVASNGPISGDDRGLPEARRKTKESVEEGDFSRRSTKERGKEVSKEPRSNSGKDKHGKGSLSRDALVSHEASREGTQDSLNPNMNKDLQHMDIPKAYKVDGTNLSKKEKPAKERIKSEYSSKEASRLSERDQQRESALRDAYIKPSLQTVEIPQAMSSDKMNQPAEALPPHPTGNTAVAPPYVFITESWVACDICEKWRLLPPGVVEDDLPGKWRCKMLDWLAGMNNCSILEETTTHATRLLFNAAAPPPPQEVPAVVEEIQPPPNSSNPPAPLPLPHVVAPFPPTHVNLSQEMRNTDKSKAVSNKKRKMPPNTSTEAVQSKSKVATDHGQGSHERGQASKLGSGDVSTSNQEKNQAMLGGVDAGHVQGGGEEKRKVKEREKAKRLRPSDGASPLGKERSQTRASLALRDAVKMKHSANRLTEKVGMEREGTGLYLQASLKFLQAASMLEEESSENGDNRHGDGTQSLQIYADTAKLCEYCARTYEHSRDLAAAAIAYKCVGLARMRVVQAKTVSISKDRAELQSCHQAAPCESPSSSAALDVDSINNVAADRVPTRGAASPAVNPQMGGSFIIAAKNRPRFNRVLQYVVDTNAAIDALSKSHSSFRAAKSATVYSPESMTALKRVLEFGFHDVETLVRLVRVALEAIEQQQRA